MDEINSHISEGKVEEIRTKIPTLADGTTMRRRGVNTAYFASVFKEIFKQTKTQTI